MFTRRLALTIASLLALYGCAPSPQLKKVEPSLARIGNPETITLEFDRVPPQSRLRISPNAPSIISKIELRTHSSRALVAGDAVWIQTAPNRLAAISNKNDRHSDSHTIVTRDTITSYATTGNEIWVYLEDKTLLKYRISTTVALFQQTSTNTRIVLSDIQKERVCVIDENNQLTSDLVESIRQSKSDEITLTGKVVDLATMSSGCAVLFDSGKIVYYKYDGAHVKETSNYKLSSIAHRVRSWNDTLHIANGDTGYTLLELDETDSIRWLGSYQKAGSVIDIAIENDFALIASTDDVFSLINIKQLDNPVLVADFNSDQKTRAIALLHRHGFQATSDNINILDFSVNSTPLLTSLGASWGGGRRSTIENGLMYVADWFSGLHIYDIQNPAKLRLLSTFHTTGSAKGVLVHNKIAYVGDDDHGLEVIDVRNPTQPKLLTRVPLTGLAYTMARDGDRLYLASHHGGLHIIDIAQPDKAHLLGSFDTPGKTWAVQIKNKLAYLADDKNGVLVLNVDNPERISVIGQYNPGGQAEDVVLSYPFLHVAFFDLGYVVLDISDPTNIKPVSHLPLAGNTRGIALKEKMAFIAAWQAGVHAVDISDVAKPKLIGSFDTSGSAWGLSVENDTAFIMDWWGGVKTISVKKPAAMYLIASYHNSEIIRDVSASGNFVFAASGERGLQIFDSRNALNPIWATTLDIDNTALSITAQKETAYIGTQNGIVSVNISEPYHPSLISRLKGEAVVQLVSGREFLCARYASGLVEILKTAATQLPTSLYISDFASTSISANGNDCFAATKQGVYRISLDSNTNVTKTLFNRPSAELVVASDRYLYSVNSQLGITVVEINTGKPVKTVLINHTVASAFVDEKETLYVTEPNKALRAYRFENAELDLVDIFPTRHNIDKGVAVNRALFFGGESALVSTEQLPRYDYSIETNSVLLKLPGTMPQGSFNISLALPNKNTVTYTNAFQVGFPTPKKQRFTLDDLKKKMLQKDFEGRSPTNKN